MALIGKYTKHESVNTGETEILTIEYPANLAKNHPDYKKRGTTEEVEVNKTDLIETVYESVYLTVHSVTSWKFKTNEGSQTLANINFRIYKNKEDRINDLESVLHQDHLVSQVIDYSLEENEIQQAYNIVKATQGCEELIND